MNNQLRRNNLKISTIERFAKILTFLLLLANSLLIFIECNERIAAIINSPDIKVLDHCKTSKAIDN